jgi:hypothetical protein
MNWTVAAVFAYVLLGLELAVSPALAFGSIAPSFVIPLVAFVALHAPAVPALWFALIMGALLDLTGPLPTTDGRPAVVTLGPMALGYLAAAYVALTSRGLLVRRNPLTLIVLSIVVALVAHLVATTLLTFRSFYDPVLMWSPAEQLGRRVMSALYTGATGAVMTVILTPLTHLFGFQDQHTTRRIQRRTY